MNRKTLPLNSQLLLLFFTIVMFTASAFATSKYQVLWRFQQNGAPGNTPEDLIADSAGNLYGTNSVGGKYGFGTVFELSPPATQNGKWTMTVLYSFTTGSSLFGAGPGSLILDSTGNLYGTTIEGGELLFGSVFRLQPPATKGGKWTENDLYSFSSWDGYEPEGLALDAAGDLYGTTRGGGRYCAGFGCGTVYKLTPTHGGSWKRTVLYFFRGVLGGTGDGDGADPIAVTFDNSGNLFGTTLGGGHCVQGLCSGTVFELQPPQEKGKGWHEEILFRFSFSNGNDQPFSGVVIDKSGALYGSTVYAVYKLALVGGVWTQTILTSGGYIYTPVILDQSGNVYGATLYDTQDTNGKVFKLSPPNWTATVLHVFTGSPDGSAPISNLTFGLDDALYGTTLRGGTTQCMIGGGEGCGTVFKVAP